MKCRGCMLSMVNAKNKALWELWQQHDGLTDDMMEEIVTLFSLFPFCVEDLAPSYHVLCQVGQVCAQHTVCLCKTNYCQALLSSTS